MQETRSFRRIVVCDGGAALAELTLVLPFLLAVLIGLIEVGRFADYGIKVANAARAGVQYGAQNISTASDAAGMRSAAVNDTQSVSGLTVTAKNYCTCADGSADAGCVIATCSATHRIVYVEVDTVGKLPSLFNYPGIPASLKTITVTRSAIMRVAE